MADQLTGLGSISKILRIEPEWSNEPVAEFALSREIIGFPGTVQEIVLFSDERPAKWEIGFMFFDRKEEFALVDFVIDKLGMWEQFWFPSPVSFFTISGNHLTSDTNIRVKDNGFLKTYHGYERVYIKKTNGDLLTFEITNVTDGPGADEITLTIGVALAADMPETDVEMISLLHLVRFDKDQFDFEYRNGETGTLKTAVEELVKEYP